MSVLAAAPVADPSEECTASLVVGGFRIYNPSLIPLCLAAVYIGIAGGNKIRKATKYTGHIAYSNSFYMYAVMMFHSMLIHTVTKTIDIKWYTALVGLIDCGLTSSIAVSFLWNALVDLKLLDEKSCKASLLWTVSYLAFFAAWTYSFLYAIRSAFKYLYLYTILITCGSYVLIQLYYLVRRARCAGFAWLIVAGLSGGVGVSAIMNSALVCKVFGAYYNASFVWDLFSNLAMMFLLRYYFASRVEDIRTEVAVDEESAEAPIDPEDADFERAVELSLIEAQSQKQKEAAVPPMPQPQFYIVPIQPQQVNGQYMMMQPMYMAPQ